MVEEDWTEAESLFSDALAEDVNYGPAHNNLGQVYLRPHQLYLAAWEFEFAANLMPDRTEPLVNLGLVYETAGQLDKAREHYEAAYERSPKDANALANLARISVKLDTDPARIHWLLNQLVLLDNRTDWLKWAKDLLATRYQVPGVLIIDESDSVIASEAITVPKPVDVEALPPPTPRVHTHELPFPAIEPPRMTVPPPLTEAVPPSFGQSQLPSLPVDLPVVPSFLPSGSDASVVLPSSYSPR